MSAGAVNEVSMDNTLQEAMRGMSALVRVNIHPHVVLYRFACSRDKDGWAGKWWVGYTPFQALIDHAVSRQQSLSDAAGTCLAIDRDWGIKDVLLKVFVSKPLSAWSGTPLAQHPRVSKRDRHYKDRKALRPDKDITQFFIPGLSENDPETGRPIWQSAFGNMQSVNFMDFSYAGVANWAK